MRRKNRQRSRPHRGSRLKKRRRPPPQSRLWSSSRLLLRRPHPSKRIRLLRLSSRMWKSSRQQLRVPSFPLLRLGHRHRRPSFPLRRLLCRGANPAATSALRSALPRLCWRPQAALGGGMSTSIAPSPPRPAHRRTRSPSRRRRPGKSRTREQRPLHKRHPTLRHPIPLRAAL